MQTIPVIKPTIYDPNSDEPLRINAPLVAEWLVEFLRDEVQRRRGFSKALLGLSGGVDSSVVAYLCARAFGPENVYAFLMPYKVSSPESLEHGMLVVRELGIHHRVIEITPMVDAYLERFEPDASPTRIGNICARMRMIILFDQSAKLNALPIGTGNKSERLFGYFTWHADDSPP
jgi:NAD+ synthetase